ncbi:hypothetical protein cypCar_00008661, partial [Cyprinus carpio]
KVKALYDTQTPVCPICHAVLRPRELQEHMELEMEHLMQLHNSQGPAQKGLAAGPPKSLFSMHIKREGSSSASSPRPADEAVHSDRYQTFLRVRANRQTRLNARIGKLKRRKAEEDQRDSVCVVDDGSVLSAGRDFEWAEQRRIQMVSVLRGFRGLVSSTLKEHQDSDADLDVDGDDTLEYGKAHLPDDPSLSTLEALKTRIRDLEKQLTRGDRFKCLICMVSLTVHIYLKRI